LEKQKRIHDQTALIDCEPEVMPPFIMQQDPTVLFAGIPSVRNEHSSGKSLLVRLGGQENTDDPSKNANVRTGLQ
jgi:hypothetical protein